MGKVLEKEPEDLRPLISQYRTLYNDLLLMKKRFDSLTKPQDLPPELENLTLEELTAEFRKGLDTLTQLTKEAEKVFEEVEKLRLEWGRS